MTKNKQINEKEMVYFLTLFKIEGHQTFRASLKSDADGFDREVKNTVNYPKITEKKIIKIDRITGNIIK